MAMSRKQTSLVNDYRTMFEEEHDRQPNLDNETILGIINSVEGTDDDSEEERVNKMLEAEPSDDNGDGAHDRTPEPELTGEELARMAEIEKQQARSAAALAVKFDAVATKVAAEVVDAGKKWKGGPILIRPQLLRLYGKKIEINGVPFIDLPDFPNVDSEKGSNKFPTGPNGLFDRYKGTRTNADGVSRTVTLSWYKDWAERTEYGKSLLKSVEYRIGKDASYKTDGNVPDNVRKMPVAQVRTLKADDKADYDSFRNSVRKAVKMHTKVRDMFTYLGDKVNVFITEDRLTSLPIMIQQKDKPGNFDQYTLSQLSQLDPLAASKMGGENVIANLNHTLERDRKKPAAKASQGFDANMSVDTAFNGLNTLAGWADPKTDLGKKHVAEAKRKLSGEGSEAYVLIMGSVYAFFDAVWTDEMHNQHKKLTSELDKLDGAERAAKIAALQAKEAEKPAAAA